MFNSFKAKEIDLLIIAGEASGDEHAAHLVKKVLRRLPELNIAVMGGKNLRKSGAHFLFDLVDHAVVGIFEVLKNYVFFKNLFSYTLGWIRNYKPKAILLVDYPGFNLRLADALRKEGLSQKGGGRVRILQYVSPQLWAWKPKRRFKMAKVLDALAVIFPFEVECYDDISLPVYFVGHPFVSEEYLSPVHYDENGVILLLPGSRIQPVQRILPAFLDASEKIIKSFPDLKILVPVPSFQIKRCVEQILSTRITLKERVIIAENLDNLKVRAALMSSGTMSFACAMAGIPGVIAYKTHPLTYILGKILIKVPYLGMANLLLPQQPPYREFVQSKASGESMYLEIEKLLKNKSSGEGYKDASVKLRNLLQGPQEFDAVDWLVRELGMV